MAVIATSSVMVFLRIDALKLNLSEMGSHAGRVVDQVIPLTGLIAGLRLEVAQVQQFLSDISATRGQDGLADGLKEAAEHAEKFHENLEAAVKTARALGMDTIVRGLDEVGKNFGPFYAVGQRMAHAYMEGGASVGNAMMPEVDKVADALDKELKGLIKDTDRASKSQLQALTTLIADIQADSSVVKSISTIASAIVTAIAIGFILFLMSG
ncbi:MAG: hypothetical protein WCJ64_19435, partial [Rhodospirillaceae bacterium]